MKVDTDTNVRNITIDHFITTQYFERKERKLALMMKLCINDATQKYVRKEANTKIMVKIRSLCTNSLQTQLTPKKEN